MIPKPARWLTVAALWLAAAGPPVTSVEFAGAAQIGSATRTATLHVSCAMDGARINNLAVSLDVPGADVLLENFDFDAFEGPSGIGGRHHLAATAGVAQAKMDFSATGSYGNNGAPATTFTFTAAMAPDARSRAALHKLQAVVATLAGSAGRLLYTVANPAPGGPAVEARFDLSDRDAARLHSATARCLNAGRAP